MNFCVSKLPQFLATFEIYGTSENHVGFTLKIFTLDTTVCGILNEIFLRHHNSWCSYRYVIRIPQFVVSYHVPKSKLLDQSKIPKILRGPLYFIRGWNCVRLENKKLSGRAWLLDPNNLWVDPFPDPVSHSVFSRQCGMWRCSIAGGELVTRRHQAGIVESCCPSLM